MAKKEKIKFFSAVQQQNENYSSRSTCRRYQVSNLLCSKSQNNISADAATANMSSANAERIIIMYEERKKKFFFSTKEKEEKKNYFYWMERC